MIALVTGASSGIGAALCHSFARRGFDIIAVARRRDKLNELKNELEDKYSVRVKVICKDLSSVDACYALYNEVKKVKPDIFVNNAGFGLYGNFYETSLTRELEMIDINIKALHVLTKLFYRDFRNRNYGYILNVASAAGFLAGPYMSTYYATKNYVVQLTKAIYREIKDDKANVYIGALCPGPVNTEFNEVAGVSFSMEGLSDTYVAEYTAESMFDGDLLIIPGNLMKTATIASKFAPTKLALKVTGHIQKSKG